MASSLNDVTLIGSYFYTLFLLHSFVNLLFCWGWQLNGRSFSCWGRQHCYIQCPLGICIQFITWCLFDYCCSKPHVFWEFENSCQTECSSVWINTNCSSDGCFWFSSFPFCISFCSTFHFCDSAKCIQLTYLVLLFFGSSTIDFVGTEVAVRDLVGPQSTAELTQSLAGRCSWAFLSTEFFCPATF